VRKTAIFLAMLALATLPGCAVQPAGSSGANSNGTATTAAQKAVGVLYGTYDTAVGAEIVYLQSATPNAALVKQIETARTEAYAALHTLMLAANTGSDLTALEAAAGVAIQTLTGLLTANNIMKAS
jgi:hypothetical protein